MDGNGGRGTVTIDSDHIGESVTVEIARRNGCNIGVGGVGIEGMDCVGCRVFGSVDQGVSTAERIVARGGEHIEVLSRFAEVNDGARTYSESGIRAALRKAIDWGCELRGGMEHFFVIGRRSWDANGRRHFEGVREGKK